MRINYPVPYRFTDLTDVPHSYVGFSSKILSVNGGENAIEFVTDPNTEWIDNELVAGSGTTFTLAFTPKLGSVKLFATGTRITVAAGDFTISGKIITTTLSWLAGDIVADYRV